MPTLSTHRTLAALLAFAGFAAATPARAELAVGLYAELLLEYTEATPSTVGTRVDYAELARDARWPKLLASLEAAKPPAAAARAERLAFWINAYNILAIRTVTKHYPLDSIRDVGSFLSPVWKRVAGRIDGQDVTLHRIEHEILRKTGEPRIHAAIVCASTSCPSLAREPFTAEALDAQLDATTQRWLDNANKGIRIDRAHRRVYLSSIFNWFSGDFTASGGALAFAMRYASASDAAWVKEHKPSVEYFDYDWSLNDWPHSRLAQPAAGRAFAVASAIDRLGGPRAKELERERRPPHHPQKDRKFPRGLPPRTGFSPPRR